MLVSSLTSYKKQVGDGGGGEGGGGEGTHFMHSCNHNSRQVVARNVGSALDGIILAEPSQPTVPLFATTADKAIPHYN